MICLCNGSPGSAMYLLSAVGDSWIHGWSEMEGFIGCTCGMDNKRKRRKREREKGREKERKKKEKKRGRELKSVDMMLMDAATNRTEALI